MAARGARSKHRRDQHRKNLKRNSQGLDAPRTRRNDVARQAEGLSERLYAGRADDDVVGSLVGRTARRNRTATQYRARDVLLRI